MDTRTTRGLRRAQPILRGPRARTLFREMNIPDSLRSVFAFLHEMLSREAFLTLFALMFSRGSYERTLVRRAYDVAEEVFRDELRDSGERYFEHLRRCVLILVVFLGVRDANLIAAMLLHDIIEAFPDEWPVERVEREFNLIVTTYVSEMTRPVQKRGMKKREVDDLYHAQLKAAGLYTILLKGVDRLDNLFTFWTTMPSFSVRRTWKKILETQDFILPLLEQARATETHLSLAHVIRAVLKFIEEKLENEHAH